MVTRSDDELAAAKALISSLNSQLDSVRDSYATLRDTRTAQAREKSVTLALQLAVANPAAIPSTSALITSAGSIYDYLKS